MSINGFRHILREHGKHNQKAHGNWIGKIIGGLKTRVLGKPEQKVKVVSPKKSVRKTVPKSERPSKEDMSGGVSKVKGWADTHLGLTVNSYSVGKGITVLHATMDEPRGNKEYTAKQFRDHVRTQFPNALVTGRAMKSGIEVKINHRYKP